MFSCWVTSDSAAISAAKTCTADVVLQWSNWGTFLERREGAGVVVVGGGEMGGRLTEFQQCSRLSAPCTFIGPSEEN